MTVKINLNGLKTYIGFGLLLVARLGPEWFEMGASAVAHLHEIGLFLAGIGGAHKVQKLIAALSGGEPAAAE